MVATIIFKSQFRRVLQYHERKVNRGVAELVHAGNFLEKPSELDLKTKLSRFEERLELNSRAKFVTIHILLGWNPKDLEKISGLADIAIVEEYMKRIRLDEQPYLVYRHYDSAHPHMHVVTNTIRPDGSRINEWGLMASWFICRDLERKWGLVITEKRQRAAENVKEKRASNARFDGKMPIAVRISSAIDSVIDQYKYGSLEEFNAILRDYRVRATRGRENSKLYQLRGLLYEGQDDNGKFRAPIKASFFDSQPTLAKLEKRFRENEASLEPESLRIRNSVDWVLVRPPASVEGFIRAMEKERVQVSFAAL